MLLARALIVTLTFGILAAPLPADAQPPGRAARVGWLHAGDPTSRAPRVVTFRQGLRELGWVEGQNIVVEYRWAEGKVERLPDLAAELVRLQVDLIFAVSTSAALAVKRATKTIPIVFVAVGDPVGSGVVASLARPGGNITGLTHMTFELEAKRLELLKETVPGVSRVAVLWDPDFPSHEEWLKAVKVAASTLRVELQPLEFRKPQDFEGAIATAKRGGAGALLAMAHPLIFSHKTRLAELAAGSRLPAILPYREFAEVGGLMAYGASLHEMWRRAVVFVDKILKGTKPADLPVEQPTKFELVINLKTAKALGLTIPQSVLFRADQLIQ